MSEAAAEHGPRPDAPLLRVRGLKKHYAIPKGLLGRGGGTIRAVDGIDLDLWPGETLALVGESGCGKSTTARAILRLVEPTAGEVTLAGADVLSMDRQALRTLRRRVQIVFQDQAGVLNPRLSVGRALGEALRVHGLGGDDPAGRVRDLLERVGLDHHVASRYPHELSGGQRQRVGIARALSVEPELIVLDEPVSALDASVRAHVVNLLLELQRDLGLAYLFIAHDLPLVEFVADRVAVMYLGRIVESAPARMLFESPVHPYARALLSAVPTWAPGGLPRRRRAVLGGEPPAPRLRREGARSIRDARTPRRMRPAKPGCPPWRRLALGVLPLASRPPPTLDTYLRPAHYPGLLMVQPFFRSGGERCSDAQTTKTLAGGPLAGDATLQRPAPNPGSGYPGTHVAGAGLEELGGDRLDALAPGFLSGPRHHRHHLEVHRPDREGRAYAPDPQGRR